MEWFPQTAFASLKQSSSKSECSYWSRVAVSVRVNNRQSMGILSLNFDFFFVIFMLCYFCQPGDWICLCGYSTFCMVHALMQVCEIESVR